MPDFRSKQKLRSKNPEKREKISNKKRRREQKVRPQTIEQEEEGGTNTNKSFLQPLKTKPLGTLSFHNSPFCGLSMVSTSTPMESPVMRVTSLSILLSSL